MRQIQLVILFVVILSGQMLAQTGTERYRISGAVIDTRTGLPLKRIPFDVLPFKQEVKADKDGKFLLNMPIGKEVTLVFDYYPFDKQEIVVSAQKDTTITVSLTSPFANQYLEEVEVIAGKPVNDKPMSVERLDKQLFLTLPTLMGERDVIKALSITAGVSSSGEGTADMQVRGGTHGQNLYLLNDAPLYFTQHALGLISAYNPTIVRNAVFYKAAFPAQYGGKVSSILEVNTIEPSLVKLNGELELGIISSKGMINFPIVKDKLGLYLSGRIFNLTPFLGFFNSFTEKNDTKMGISFSDINAGVKYKIDTQNELNLDFFRVGDDWNIKQKDFNNVTKLTKDNSQLNFSLNWLRKPHEETTDKLSIYADNFISGQRTGITSEIKDQPTQFTEFGFHSAITTLNLSENFSRKLNEKLQLSFGGSYQDNIIHPLRFLSPDSSSQNTASASVIHFHEGSLFSEGVWDVSSKQKLTLGLRASATGSSHAFFSVEPRVAYQLQLPDDYSLSASLSRMSQSIHRVANAGLGIPMEIFVPSSVLLPPEFSWTSSIGAGKEITKFDYRITMKADFWYKSLKNIVEFQDGMDAYSMLTKGYNVYDVNQLVVTNGHGNAYGLDFSLSFNRKNMTLIADYTLMKAVNQFRELNNGNPFPASTDIRNSLALTWSYKFKHNLLVTANWQFNSGRPITVPTYVLPNVELDLAYNEAELNHLYDPYIYLYTERNNYRTRAFHKLDISLTKNFLFRRKHQSSFSIGLYNAYNQSNPFVYTLSIKREPNNVVRPVLNSASVFPILPSFSWRVQF